MNCEEIHSILFKYTKHLLFVYFSLFDFVFDFVFRLNCIIIVMLSCSRNILDLET